MPVYYPQHQPSKRTRFAFVRRYPLIPAFLIAILVANIWKISQLPSSHDLTAETPAATTAAPSDNADSSGEAAGTGTPAAVLPAVTTAPTPVFTAVDASYFDDALFIGDSRTEGLALYGSLTHADFFSSVGLSIYTVTEKAAGNPNLGESMTLSQKLAGKQYGKVYIMLGLNELGTGSTESWAQTYSDVVAQIRQAQPNATIYLESILVVAASQDDPNGAINNATVNARNQALEALANPQQNIYYLNVNEVVSDANGCLDASLTSDGIHLLGNSLSLWENYLKQHAIAPAGGDSGVGSNAAPPPDGTTTTTVTA